MYELEWRDERVWRQEAAVGSYASRLRRDAVASTLLLHWQEHCVECAMPDCYKVCPLYAARGDQACARFEYGIYPHAGVPGLLDYGADVRFKRWGTILSNLWFGRSVSPTAHRRLAAADRAYGKLAPVAAGLVRREGGPGPGAVNFHRERVLRRLPGAGPGTFDEFVLECVLPEPEPMRLVLEHVEDKRVRFRHAFELQPGQNFHTLPASVFGDVGQAAQAWLHLSPEADAERRVIFSWLDVVKYREGRRPEFTSSPAGGADAPAEKVKCVAWDLDNTLWSGTLVEGGGEARRLRADVLATIERLDERGIVQTVVSKNDHDEAWEEIVRLGLGDWFVYPAINWGRKSENLREVARRLNIGLDTLALIDDSPFEREEVREALPMVRVYAEDQLPALLERPELDVPVTMMSRQRRLSYLTEMRRERVQESFGEDYLGFLSGCEMTARVFRPTSEAEVVRCRELVARSNQLNLAKRAYTPEEFAALLETPGMLPLGLACADRFGDYGIVGFLCVDERGPAPVVRDFVLSCRVAQKRVEHAVLGWLAGHEGQAGADRLQAEIVKTERNGPLQRVFDDLPFRTAWSDGPRALLEMSVGDAESLEQVVALDIDLGPSSTTAR